jgi:phage baseplate assembly protein W
MAVGYAPELPLHVTNEDGPYALLKTLEGVGAQNLKMLVLTSPGERIMDGKFGVGIRNYLFWQYVPATLSNIENRIRAQTIKYLPYIKINNIVFNNGQDVVAGGILSDSLLSIRIEYSIVPLEIGAVLTIPISL